MSGNVDAIAAEHGRAHISLGSSIRGVVAPSPEPRPADLQPHPIWVPPGYDAIRKTANGSQSIQIKGHAYGEDAKSGQRLGIIKRGADCDFVVLVLLDNRTLEPRDIWEAPYQVVEEGLNKPGKARARCPQRTEVQADRRRVWPA